MVIGFVFCSLKWQLVQFRTRKKVVLNQFREWLCLVELVPFLDEPFCIYCLAEGHATGSRKAIQTIAFYGNGNEAGFPLSEISRFVVSACAPPCGRNSDVLFEQEMDWSRGNACLQ